MKDFFDILNGFLAGDVQGERIFGGSDRQFFRVPAFDATCIILLDRDIEGLVRYAHLLENLAHYGIPVSRVYALDEGAGAMVLEDVGEVSLFDWYSTVGDIEPHFRAVEVLTKIHKLEDIPSKGGGEAEFDVADLIYETQYFIRHFLVGYCGFPEGVGNSLLDEFRTLAQKAATSPKGLMHRDYQSQNIFVVPGGVKVIDFQGARRGFLAYDLASLTEDPYVSLPYRLRREMLKCYLELWAPSRAQVGRFLESFPYNALQRLLQATAAFSYLSKVQGKTWFEKFIEPALSRISEWLEMLDEFEILRYVVNYARKSIFEREKDFIV